MSTSRVQEFDPVELHKLSYDFKPSPPIYARKARVIHEPTGIESLVCPLSLEKFVNPVVDRCGHSFEKDYIHQYCRVKSKDGKTFPCPINPSNMINIDDLVKNFNLCQALEETNKEIIASTADLAERITKLENKSVAQDKVLLFMQKQMSDQEQIINVYKMQRRIRKKQLRNLQNMTVYDRLNTVFFYSYLSTVQNRGLSSFDLELLKMPVTQKKT